MDLLCDRSSDELLLSIRREAEKEASQDRDQALSMLTEKLIRQISRTLLSNNLEIAATALNSAKIYEQAAAFTLIAQDPAAIYQLGRISGACTALQPFVAEMSEEEELKQVRDSAPKYFDQILDYLGRYGKETQGNIASRLGVSPSNLSNILKRMGNAGAVYCEKSGKYHHYYLTPMGQKYWKKRISTLNEAEKDVRFDVNEELGAEDEMMMIPYILKPSEKGFTYTSPEKAEPTMEDDYSPRFS